MGVYLISYAQSTTKGIAIWDAKDKDTYTNSVEKGAGEFVGWLKVNFMTRQLAPRTTRRL